MKMYTRIKTYVRRSVPLWICSSFLICVACNDTSDYVEAISDPSQTRVDVISRIKVPIGVPTPIPVLSNDMLNGAVSNALTLSGSIPSLPQKGTVAVSSGQVVYTGTAIGLDQFSYIASYSNTSDVGTVYVEVEGVPNGSPPVAVDDNNNGDYFIVPHQVSTRFDVLANDDGKGLNKLLVSVDLPANINDGTVEVPGSTVGQFDLTYLMTNTAGSDTGLLKVRVEPSASIFFQNQSSSDIRLTVSGRTTSVKTISGNQSELIFFVPNAAPSTSQIRVERLPTLHPSGVTNYDFNQNANSLILLKYTESPDPTVGPS